MRVQPYLSFEGRCEEAIEFYKQAAGAQVVAMMRFSDGPEGSCGGAAPAPKDKIMHACLKIGDDNVMMSDGMCAGAAEFKGITLALSVENDQQVREKFAALSAGGQVMAEPSQTFFASLWGMCTDKFGVGWMVLAPVPVPAAK
jgi:PhnB protein